MKKILAALKTSGISHHTVPPQAKKITSLTAWLIQLPTLDLQKLCPEHSLKRRQQLDDHQRARQYLAIINSLTTGGALSEFAQMQLLIVYIHLIHLKNIDLYLKNLNSLLSSNTKKRYSPTPSNPLCPKQTVLNYLFGIINDFRRIRVSFNPYPYFSPLTLPSSSEFLVLETLISSFHFSNEARTKIYIFSIQNNEHITALPSWFSQLTSIEGIYFQNCPNLSSILHLPPNVNTLFFKKCPKLTEMPPNHNFSQLKTFYYLKCAKVNQLPESIQRLSQFKTKMN